MQIVRTFFLLAFGAFVTTAALPAMANQDLSLSNKVKQSLMAAPAINGKGVTRDSFNGKPVLVTFFASW